MARKNAVLIVMAFVVATLVGCKKSPDEIFSEEKSGVVLICNEYYYDITLANGNHIYFTGLDGDGDFTGLTSDKEEVTKNPAILNGTGFFIDQTGRILTNRHVVAPGIDKSTVRTLAVFPHQQVSIFNFSCHQLSANGLRWKPWAFERLWCGSLNEALDTHVDLEADGTYLVFRTFDGKDKEPM